MPFSRVSVSRKKTQAPLEFPKESRRLKSVVDYRVCENTVAKLMNSEGITSSTAKKFRVSTTDSNHSLPVAENILDRDFTAKGLGQKVVSDLTYIATAEGFLYLVCMIDVFSRRVIGWSMSHEMTTDVFLSALEMALGRMGGKDDLLCIQIVAVSTAVRHFRRRWLVMRFGAV